MATGVVVTGVAIWLSRTYLWAAEFPSGSPVGPWIVPTATDASTILQINLSVLTWASRTHK